MELMCGWKDGAHIISELTEKLGGHSQVPLLMWKEFPREAKGSAIHKIRSRAVGIFPPGCPDAKGVSLAPKPRVTEERGLRVQKRRGHQL